MRLYFTPQAKMKLDLYIQLSGETEVSGLGKVERHGRDDFLCSDVVLFEQASSWAGTELSQEAVAEFFEAVMERSEDPGQYRLWWHSHGDHPCYWSRVDEKTIERLGSSWLVSVVGNVRSDLLARIDVFDPVHLGMELPTGILLEGHPDLNEAIKKELSEKVHQKKIMYPMRARWREPRYDDWPEEKDEGECHEGTRTRLDPPA
jgi:proteasome lid subunit RPN8/RPN11